MPKRNFLKLSLNITCSKLFFSSEEIGLAQFQHEIYQAIKVQEWTIGHCWTLIRLIKRFRAKSATYKMLMLLEETFKALRPDIESIDRERRECAKKSGGGPGLAKTIAEFMSYPPIMQCTSQRVQWNYFLD